MTEPPFPPAPPGPEPLPPQTGLAALSEQIPDLGSVFERPEEPSDEDAVRGDQPLPGDPEEQIELDDREQGQFCQELLTLLELYDIAQAGRNEREEEIEGYYALSDSPLSGGTTSDAEHIISEMTMSQVDQATARIVENVMATEPLMQVDPVVKTADPEQMDVAKELAEATQRFLNSFAMSDMKLDRKLPIAIHRTVKVGTAVLHPKWVRRSLYEKYWDVEGKEQTIDKETGGIDVEIPNNRHVIVYPPNKGDWQDCTMVGHRTYMSIAEWRTYATNVLDMTRDEAETIEISPQSEELDPRTSHPEREDAYFGIKKDQDLEDRTGHIQITQLYVNMPIPGEFEPRRMHVILSEPRKRILFLSENRHHKKRIPYFPIRYKVVDDMAWGLGLGDEIVYCQAADSAMRNLQMDNLMSGAYHIVQVKAGTMADVLLDRPLPGQVVATDNPGEDMVITPMGGKAEGLEEAVQDNRFRAREASGLAPVLGGQGDPIMKSGAGTGSTVALIEQAGKKFGHVDRTIREDFDQFAGFVLEMVTQYGTEGLFYQHVSEEDAQVVELLLYEPLRGPVEENLRVRVQAPNAATSKEGRKSTYMVAWQFINQHYQMLLQLGEPVMMQSNPGGWQQYKEEVLGYLDVVAKAIIQHQDLPGLVDEMPPFPELTPQDQIINDLQMQLQQMQEQMMQMQQMAEQAGMSPEGAGAPPPPGGAPPMGGGMPQ